MRQANGLLIPVPARDPTSLPCTGAWRCECAASASLAPAQLDAHAGRLRTTAASVAESCSGGNRWTGDRDAREVWRRGRSAASRGQRCAPVPRECKQAGGSGWVGARRRWCVHDVGISVRAGRDGSPDQASSAVGHSNRSRCRDCVAGKVLKDRRRSVGIRHTASAQQQDSRLWRQPCTNAR